ncbi:MAG: 6-phosphofructokinase [Betaproteobacteria bacterium]|jgi:ATP-dependent phosphofructokinase / diphosphate-dependent phosphofructokinase|nr:6-phosphofructokinase [Betaproteobacteria bacterium]NBT10226.1 6-phosphofructokinase [Betaproteobacteria bacterium]NBU48527.1 6-phosphofructokinase [Betaproteobacteria bacterium]NBX96655.1 6-phosphofructokinase [Betaproteobacteria bacterium]
MAQVKVLIAQGGGPTAVINQSLVGAVLAARAFPQVQAVYGARHGVRGVLNEDFVDLTGEDVNHLERVAASPSSALGSTRDKPDTAYCLQMLEVIKAHGITHFLYIGGNDSSDTVRILMAEAARSGHTLAGMHIPKTIDNDLMGNDHTPGFPSAAKFVAQAFAGADLDNAALPGVYVAVVMGRHAGFLTAAAALARQGVDDGPHLIYLPERAFEMDRFLADVKRTHERLGRCVVAVSEGIHDASGHPIITRLTQGKGGTAERDAHGNVQLSGTGALADLLSEEVKSRLGIKRVRGDTFGYLQRSFLGCVSDVDAREARDVGAVAVRMALKHGASGSVAIRRDASAPGYVSEYTVQPLEAVAAKTRVMDQAFIHAAGHDVTPAFVDYLRPLLGSQLPQAERLKGRAVAKRLRPQG